MIGEHSRFHPTVQIPSWDPLEDHLLAGISSPVFIAAAAVDGFSSDHFRMFEFKVRRCARGKSHDWTECPYAHPGEKARRRDPKKCRYSGTACPEFRKGNCKKGDSCDLAHGIFECWLHPTRYRTLPCKDGPACRRRVCFFAHSPDQLRFSISGDSIDESSLFSILTSPTSILSNPISDSPPISPISPKLAAGSFNSMNRLVSLMGNLQIEKKSQLTHEWGVQLGQNLGSPAGGGLFNLPANPTTGNYESWGKLKIYEEEPAMERVESGKNIRAKMYEKLSRDNSVEQVDSTLTPDVGWISELLM